jgi:thioredoxin-like negative regulator of GroEL
MNTEDIEQLINTNDALLLYFSGKNCGVCQALMPKIKSSFELNFPKIKQMFINADEYPAISAHFSIFTVPSILIFFEGKECRRESRHISVENLVQSTQRPYALYFN